MTYHQELVQDLRVPEHEHTCNVCRKLEACELHDPRFPEFANFKTILKMSNHFIETSLARFSGRPDPDANLLRLHMDALQRSSDFVARFSRWEVKISFLSSLLNIFGAVVLTKLIKAFYILLAFRYRAGVKGSSGTSSGDSAYSSVCFL